MSKASFEQLPHSRVRLSFTIPADEVRAQYQAAITDYTKKVAIKGFRKGHVPRDVIVARFGDDVRADALSRTVNKAVHTILEEHDGDYASRLLRYDPPMLIGEPKYDPEKQLEAKVEFDIFPKFTLPQYTDLQITIPDVVVREEDIEREIARLQQNRATYHPRGEQEAAENGDAVVVDLHDTAGNARKDARFIIGDGAAPDFSTQLVGMKVGEQRQLAQKDAQEPTTTATLTAVQRLELPVIDDAFAHDVKETFASLDDLRLAIRNELEAHAQDRLEQIKRTGFLRTVAAKVSIDLPRSMVRAEKQRMWRQLLEQYNITEERLLETFAREGRTQEQLFQDWDADTVQRLKELLVLHEIQQKEQINMENSDLDAFIAKRAAKSGHDPQTLRQLYIDNKTMGNVIEDCAEGLLFDRLFKKTSFVMDKNTKIK